MVYWCLVLVISVSTIRVHSQLDSNGFININCGLAANSTSIDGITQLTYVSDDQFIDTGANYKIASKYASNYLPKQYLTVRSFPNGTRNCYTLRSLSAGSKYLIRGSFMYGNYDNKSAPPTFDLHLGVNYWYTVTITTSDDVFYPEIIATATSDYLQVCLINKDHGTPFISVLELRQLETTLYRDANATQSLVLSGRLNLGASDDLRYPHDLYDRFWWNYALDTWTNISTNSTVQPDTDFATPSIVMQTAATTSSTQQSLDIPWSSDSESTVFLVILHYGEIQDIPSTALREFDIFGNGILAFKSTVPKKLDSGWASYTHTNHDNYNVSLKATPSSTLPPILNAFELYIIRPATGIPTYTGDVSAINEIKANYQVNKGWSGDPCVPTELSWTGVTCTSDSRNIPRITSLNLSSFGLHGTILSSFGNLSTLKSLDLSYNGLSGNLPSFLDQLSDLTYLDITGNSNISTTLPPGLEKRKQDGKLTFRPDNPAPAPAPPPPPPPRPILVKVVIASAIVLLLFGAIIIIVLCLKRRIYSHINLPKPDESYGSTPGTNNYVGNYADGPDPNGQGEGILNLETRQLTYNDLKKITNNFQKKIGTGGFGSVYVGDLENGTQVAVKMLSESSHQGLKEFLAEAQNLTRVHHKNLVSLLGYSMDGDCLALVYEYMQEGNLENNLRDNGRPLNWKQRLRIAYESAKGLEYLHKECAPPLIHRDVKTNNILLGANFEAKIADFGLARAFNNASSHVSTAVAGTPGYMDPEYYSSNQLSEKSDVFSFGVVLLEIVTGKPAVIGGPEGGHLTRWVSQKLSRGEIESIVDPRMHGQYDINSVWKVTDLARQCTQFSSAHRPTMNVVVTELKESLDLEISTEGTRNGSTTNTQQHNYSRNGNFTSDVSQNSAFEMPYMDGMPAPGPRAR